MFLTICPIVMCRSRLTAYLSIFLALLLGACAPVSRPREASGMEDISYSGSDYPTFAPLVCRVMPAVVNISVESQVPYEEHPFFRDPRFRRFLKQFGVPFSKHPNTSRHRSVGSGFVVDSSRGYVLTNRHVVENARSITVTLKSRHNHRSQLVGSDSRADIAVLRISPVPSGLQALRLGDSNDLEVGDFVLAIGNPFGIGQTVTSGIVSALGRQGVGSNGSSGLIQTDASINPGNSGGPLVDLGGRVVGISTALIGPGGGNVGIGFATPANRVRAAMDKILQGR